MYTMYSKNFLEESIEIINSLDSNIIENIVVDLIQIRKAGGRLFFIGVGFIFNA